jgi:branched-chain amino acid transport system substrate-binding protein
MISPFLLVGRSVLVLLGLLILFAAWQVLATLHSPDTGNPVYLAVAGPMSGDNAGNGAAMVQAARLKIEQVNRAGGINGRAVELVVYDDGNDAAQAAQVARRISTESEALAVIGHYTSSASLGAAPVYQAQGVSAMTASATTDTLTTANDWYFRLIFNNADQGVLLANYARTVLQRKNALIFSVDNAFGENLTHSFVNTAHSNGLHILQHWHYSEGDQDSFHAQVKALLKYLAANKEPAILFLALHAPEAATILTRLQSLEKTVPVIGADSLSSSGFQDMMHTYPQERARPGYFTDGVYATVPFLSDIAGEGAEAFRHAFTLRYGSEPSVTAAMYYDAATTALHAIQEALENHKTTHDLKQQRKQVRESLAAINQPLNAVEGIGGAIFFDDHGDPIRSIPVAVFQNGKPIAALEQFQPTVDLADSAEILKQAIAGQVINVNGKLMRRAQVVYTGIEFNKISKLKTDDATYIADFYIWFRFQHDYPDTELEFINIADSQPPKFKQILNKTSNIEDGIITRTYRVKTKFALDLDFSDYPLDKQILPIRFRHQTLTRDHLIYVVDKRGMAPGKSAESVSDKVRKSNVFGIGGWHLDNIKFFQTTATTNSSLGYPELFGAQQRIEHSLFNVQLEITRNVSTFILKNMLPIVLVICLSYFMFYIPMAGPGFGIRMGMAVNILVATSLFHLKLASTMPAIDYLMLIEYVFYAVYLLAVISVLLTLLNQIQLSKDEENAQTCFWVKYADPIGRILYPAFILSMLLVLKYFYY